MTAADIVTGGLLGLASVLIASALLLIVTGVVLAVAHEISEFWRKL